MQKNLHFRYKEQISFPAFRKRAELVFVVVGHKFFTGRFLFKVSRENSNHMTKSWCPFLFFFEIWPLLMRPPSGLAELENKHPVTERNVP